MERDEGAGRTMEAVVEDFCRSRPRLEDARWSFDRCLATSRALRTRLVRSGFEASLVRLSEGVRAWPDADPRWSALTTGSAPTRSHHWVHYAVLCEGMVLDCAYRQFDPGAQHPRIAPLETIREEWGSVRGHDPSDPSGWAPISRDVADVPVP